MKKNENVENWDFGKIEKLRIWKIENLKNWEFENVKIWEFENGKNFNDLFFKEIFELKKITDWEFLGKQFGDIFVDFLDIFGSIISAPSSAVKQHIPLVTLMRRILILG